MTALIDFYGRNGQLNEVCQMFDELPEPDAICLDSVISAYTCDNFDSLWEFRVVEAGEASACAERSLLDMYGKCGWAEESQHVFDRMSKKDSLAWAALLGVYSLVDLYARSEAIDVAHRIFMWMSDRNLITRSSMIYGFAQNGRGGEALTTFNEMMEGMEPDCISFTGVLYTCSHTGLYKFQYCRAHCKRSDSTYTSPTSYAVLANVYKAVGRWDDAFKLNKLRKDRGVKKTEANHTY
ncbi:hypothetical protein GOBAR_DD03629 [Gossypium barbadense]|nr:hypothetical protein GOBAR_DD03629 [Gossypium barbadense]